MVKSINSVNTELMNGVADKIKKPLKEALELMLEFKDLVDISKLNKLIQELSTR